MKHKVKKQLSLILIIFMICELVKDFEFLILKTDQTFLAENIVCKLFVIAVLFVSLKKLRFSWSDIGFKKSGVARGAIFGISLGLFTFSISYLIEFIILSGKGLHPKISFYIANFTISQQNITGVSLSALMICIFGNILNVFAEEGLFRGLLLRLGKAVYTPRMSNLIQSALFGVWHIIVIVVWVIDGSMEVPAALVMSVGYVLLAGVLGYEWGLCAALTGTLWTGAFEHFFNNFISNSLHVITETGVDELQIIRIVISNILSLLIVAALTKAKMRNLHEIAHD